jgi:hypothetical protein
MIKFLFLFLISFSLSYAQSSDSLKSFNYENSFIKAGFKYPAYLNPGFGVEELDNSTEIGSVTWEVDDSSYMEHGIFYPPVKYISIAVYVSKSHINNTPLPDIRIHYKNKDKLVYNEWKGFTYTKEINYYLQNKDTLKQKGRTYLLQKKFGKVNAVIIGDERNATGALDVMKKICETFYYEEKATEFLSKDKYNDIKEVDFYNFKYPDITVRDSLYYIENSSQSYSSYVYAITGVVFGDLTGDSKDEAAVSTYEHESGTTGHFTGGYVYTLKNSEPHLLYEIKTGDRAAEGITGIEIKDGLLWVTRVTGLGGLCCPEYEYTSSFKWQDTTFIPVDCKMHSLLEYVNAKSLKFSPDENEITVFDSTDFEIYYSLEFEKGDSISILAATLNKKRTALHLVFCSDTGLVIGGCDNYALDKLNLKITDSGIYSLRIVADAWAWKAYVETKIRKIIPQK